MKKRLFTSSSQKGFTLIELMISMVLGLVAIGAVVSLIALNSRNYRTGEAIGQIQDGMRTAFDLIARDMRQARGTGCGSLSQPIFANGFVPQWWVNANTPLDLRLFGPGAAVGAVAIGTTPASRVGTTSAIQVQGITGTSFTVTNMTAPNTFTVPGNNFVAGDVVVICNSRYSEVLQINAVGAGTVTTTTPAISDFTPVFNSPPVREVLFPTMTRYQATTWYVGNNAADRRAPTSLYRIRSNGLGSQTEEVIEGVTGLNVNFRVGNGGIASLNAGTVISTPTNVINTVDVNLTLQSADTRVGDMSAPGQQRLTRNYSTIVAVRNP